MEVQGLMGLPMELIALICSFLPHDNVLSYALTCRLLNQSALDELRARQQIFNHYKSITDDDPLALLNGLRGALSDPFNAQCVRHLRFSYLRLSWHDWTSQISEAPVENIHEDERKKWQSFYTYDELEDYRRLLRMYIFNGYSGNTLSNAHISALRDGQDDALKVLLIALCPRLMSVTFFEHPASSRRPRARTHPLASSFLAQHQAAHRILHRDVQLGARRLPQMQSWPPGFRHLRSISLCAPLEAGGGVDRYHLRPANVSGLFWLPNIKNLELRYLQHRHDGDEWIDVQIGCSNVKTLVFDHCAIQQTTLLRLISSSYSLERVTVKSSGILPRQLEPWLRSWYPSSLNHVALE